MKNVKKLLDSAKNISGYRISGKATESYELFFVHKKLETVRSTDTDSVTVTVYVEHDGRVGDSSFSVYGSMTDDEITEKIETARKRALLVNNEPYALTEGGVLDEKLPTDLDGYDTAKNGKNFVDGSWYQRHIREERHHPTSYCHDDINLLDIIEMIVDCVCAGKARAGNIRPLEINDEILKKAFNNTVKLVDNITEIED